MSSLLYTILLLAGLALGGAIAWRQSLRTSPVDEEKMVRKWQKTLEKQRSKAERNHRN